MTGFINRVVRKFKPPQIHDVKYQDLKTVYIDREDLFSRQLRYEGEGVAANNAGIAKDACPYNRETQSLEWNFWIYGWTNVESERHIIADGGYHVGSTANNTPLYWQSIADGNWKPKYLASTNIPSTVAKSE